MKDMMIDIEAERFNEWLEENYPDIVPESGSMGGGREPVLLGAGGAC
ncbi:hypothetical protein LN650_31215 [Klebsiella pneumoniae subsp. pneumoniae]|nr:hypothetical protein [Klebsiella pneumoniae subsp. pneumoniae]